MCTFCRITVLRQIKNQTNTQLLCIKWATKIQLGTYNIQKYISPTVNIQKYTSKLLTYRNIPVRTILIHGVYQQKYTSNLNCLWQFQYILSWTNHISVFYGIQVKHGGIFLFTAASDLQLQALLVFTKKPLNNII